MGCWSQFYARQRSSDIFESYLTIELEMILDLGCDLERITCRIF